MLKNVIFFDNGNVAAFDENGKQIPELQYPYIRLFVDHMKAKGYAPDGVEFHLPHGKARWITESNNWTFG